MRVLGEAQEVMSHAGNYHFQGHDFLVDVADG